jgi:hypothetical protein
MDHLGVDGYQNLSGLLPRTREDSSVYDKAPVQFQGRLGVYFRSVFVVIDLFAKNNRNHESHGTENLFDSQPASRGTEADELRILIRVQPGQDVSLVNLMPNKIRI